MPQAAIRFGVRDQCGFRSGTWKCWTMTGTGKSDVYLVSRGLGRAFKASMHESGKWHVAYDKDFLECLIEPQYDGIESRFVENRLIDRWLRPTPIGPGVTLAYRILIPASAVNLPMSDGIPSSILWVKAPPLATAVEISLVITDQGTVVSDWPGSRSMNTQLVGSFGLEDNATLWIVYRVVEMPQFGTLRGKATKFKSGRGIDLGGPGIRAILFGKASDGSRFMVECATNMSNMTEKDQARHD